MKDKEKEIPSVPTSYRILIKGASANDNKQIRLNVDDKRHVWRQCSFKNPARSDGLVLRHWRHFEKGTEYLSSARKQRKVVRNKICKNIDDDSTCTLARIDEEDSVLDSYSFARVNPSVKIYRYSDDFYMFHLADLDPSWTKDETDLLFDLCEMFELRFIAIHDCFKWRKDIPLEKLKQRYYSVTKRIVEFLFEEKIKNEIMKHGNPNHPVVLSLKDESARHPLVKFTYNADHDRDRRQMLERSYRITPEQREMEAQLLSDIKAAESLLKSEEKKRSEMKRLKRKFNVNESEVIPTPRLDQFQTKPVWLASSLISFYKSQLTQHHNDAVDEMLNELNISPPVVSSQASNELYCIVRGDAAIMINIVNKVESLRKELDHWKQLTNQPTEPEAAKVKEEPFPDTTDHMQVYQTPLTHSVIAKSFTKPKPTVGGVSTVQQVQPVPTVNPPTTVGVHEEDPMQQSRRMMVQGMPPQMKGMYPIKAQSGAASPQAFTQQMYPQFQQQMFHTQMNPRVIQHHIQQRMIQQQQFQQQQQHFQHIMPMHQDAKFQPIHQDTKFPPMHQDSQMGTPQMPSGQYNANQYQAQFSPSQRYYQTHNQQMMHHMGLQKGPNTNQK